MRILHLGRVTLNHLGVSIPGSGLFRYDTELGLRSIKMSGRIDHPTQPRRQRGARWVIIQWFLSVRETEKRYCDACSDNEPCQGKPQRWRHKRVRHESTNEGTDKDGSQK
jgi:hypothetical protein